MNDVHKKSQPDASGAFSKMKAMDSLNASEAQPYIHFESFGQLFEEIFHESEKGILLISTHGDLLKINQSGRKLLGLNNDVIGSSGKFDFKSWVSSRFEISVGFAGAGFTDITSSECVWKRRTERYEEIKWLKSNPKPFVNEMGTGAYLVVLNDITDEVDGNRVSYGILTLASHKLRTPMNHICGGLELMSTVDEKTPYSEWNEYLGYISQGVKRLQKDLFSLFRFMDMKRQGIRVGQHEIKEKRENVIKIIKHISHDLEIKNVFCFLSRLDYTVLSEETLYLVVGEILTNSGKFHPQKDPFIEIDFEKVTDGGKDFELWTFQDDGRCINSSKLSHVVQPFSQYSEFAHTGEVSGFGIGLNAISMQIAFYGGKLWIENRKDKDGVIVKFKVPRE